MLVLGAAFGPQATVVEVRDADGGRLVAHGRATHGDGGGSPHDPTTWWRALARAVAEAGEREIAAIAVAGGHPGLVLLDGAGAVLRPMQPWPDGEVADDAERLRQALGADTWARETGALPGPGTAVSRLAWLQRRDPDTFSRIGAALLPHDWLTYRLSGRPVTDRGSASLSGLWSPHREAWSADALRAVAARGQALQWEERLPRVLGPAEEADWLAASVYELLGLRGRPLVAPGTGEPMAVALALGVGPGESAVSLGAGTSVLVGLAHPVVDGSGTVRSRADAAGGHLAIVTTGGGTTVARTIAGVLDVELGALAEMALAAPPSTAGPLVVTGPDGRAGAVVTELAPGVGRDQIARAAFEGTAAGALEALDAVAAISGGAGAQGPIRLAAPDAAGPAHAQVLADLSGREVLAAPAGSMAAAGACIQAAAVLHGVDPTEVASAWQVGAGRSHSPRADPTRAERRARLVAARQRQRRAAAP